MNFKEKEIKIKKRSGEEVIGVIKQLSNTDLKGIMDLQKIICDFLDNKELYSPSSREEFLHCIDNGVILGVNDKENRLIAMGVLVKNGNDQHNYGYDIGITGEELFKVGQIESTVVLPEYRGNGLQKIICSELEELGKRMECSIMTATASPINEFSVKTFIDLGYEIILEKIKYGGLRRYVLKKNL